MPLDLDEDNNGGQSVNSIKFAHELDEIIKTDPSAIQNLNFGVYKRAPLYFH